MRYNTVYLPYEYHNDMDEHEYYGAYSTYEEALDVLVNIVKEHYEGRDNLDEIISCVKSSGYCYGRDATDDKYDLFDAGILCIE